MSRRRRAFPLVPRRRLVGTPFGEHRASRRGRGSEVAGTRPYLPGDPVSTIDWYASARLSAARGSDEFVVRELYREESPRVMIVADRRPSMALYGGGLPWLDKQAVVQAAAEAIARSAGVAGAELGYADAAGGRSYVLSPGAVAPRRVLDRVHRAPSDAAPASLSAVLAGLAKRRAVLPQGSFVFVLSDFLVDVPETTWAHLRGARLDVVPVVVQDPTWEQSFPPVHGVLVPFSTLDGEVVLVRLSAAETAARRRENEDRLGALLGRFRRLEFDPLVLDDADPAAVDASFLRWAERRRLRWRRR
ncbi:MAG TPA: DUF58 domain-containing protein [Gaiellaceae bacterium]|nr:DUF58 domain-containing protein [Gaiellaceae bacterium]